MQPRTAKINRRHVQRAITLVAVLLVVTYGYFWLRSKHGDPDLLHAPANTVGEIAAIEVKGEGSQAVIIKPDGTIVGSPEYKDGTVDQYVTWRPDGGRIFFVSDREENLQHIFRWDPDTGTIERRTIDKRPKGFLNFDVPGESSKSATSDAVVISAGQVSAIDANSGESHQLLPPPDKDAASGAGGENGSENPMEQYSQFGVSFVRAYYLKDKSYMVAVLNREDGGQAMIVQDMTQKSEPVGICQAQHIEVTVGQLTGQIAFAAEDMEIPDWYPDAIKEKFRKGNTIVWPFKHLLGIISDPKNPTKLAPILVSQDDKMTFGDPVFSPDESEIAFLVGGYQTGIFQHTGLISVPAHENASKAIRPISPGDFSHISWSPDGSKIIAIQAMPTGGHDIISIPDQSGAKATDITQGKGDFSEAVMSPQRG